MEPKELVEALRWAKRQMEPFANHPEARFSGELGASAALLDAAQHIAAHEWYSASIGGAAKPWVFCSGCGAAETHAPGCYVGMMARAAREAGLGGDA